MSETQGPATGVAAEKIDVFLSLLRNFQVVELVRSGKIIMTRGLATT